MVLTANGLVRSAEEDGFLNELPPHVKNILVDEMPKLMAWLNQPHPEIFLQWEDGINSKYANHDFLIDPSTQPEVPSAS